MQLLCTGERVKIIWDGKRISFARLDEGRANELDLDEALEVLELFKMAEGGNC